MAQVKFTAVKEGKNPACAGFQCGTILDPGEAILLVKIDPLQKPKIFGVCCTTEAVQACTLLGIQVGKAAPSASSFKNSSKFKSKKIEVTE